MNSAAPKYFQRKVAEAEHAGARLPPLMVAADRVAATIAQGVHGRRRVGVGDSFWQYRPFVEGDSATRIDWRRSARSDRHYVRDMEWEAAQTICLWRDASPSMDWRSSATLPTKRDRAELLLLALAALLFRAGEQVRHAGEGRVYSGRSGLAALAATLPPASHLPGTSRIPAHASVVLIGDFLHPLEELQSCLARFASLPARAHLIQVLDPAELELPYDGRIRFLGLEGEGETLIPRVSTIRGQYHAAIADRLARIRGLCAAAGFPVSLHRTDQPPETALMALYTSLGGELATR